jgi:Asp/Glu/hydantoin racemase
MMTRPQILVINPNSNDAVTQGFAGVLARYDPGNGPEIRCITLVEGPFGIESQADAESAVMPLCRLVEANRDAAAFVIACFSDPGLHVCREAARRPVFGMAECGVLTAMAHADRFGVIAISDKSIPRHGRYLRQMGVMDRFVGEVALNISVADTTRDRSVLDRLVAAGRDLRDRLGASAVVLGCAGFSRQRTALQEALGIPVIDPVQAAVGMAIGAVLSQS